MVVYPVRTDSSGHTISLDITSEFTSFPNRRKRQAPDSNDEEISYENIEADKRDSKIENEDEKFFVIINNQYEELFLHLKQNKRLVSPHTLVEWVLEDGSRIIKNSSAKNCFYVGHEVNTKGNSLVAVSNCNGLTGYIQTNNESYFIEPITKQEINKQKLSDSKNIDTTRLHQRDDRIFQHITNSTSRLPHVIYKVESILHTMNLSLKEDQEFSLDNNEKDKKVDNQALNKNQIAALIKRQRHRFRNLSEKKNELLKNIEKQKRKTMHSQYYKNQTKNDNTKEPDNSENEEKMNDKAINNQEIVLKTKEKSSRSKRSTNFQNTTKPQQYRKKRRRSKKGENNDRNKKERKKCRSKKHSQRKQKKESREKSKKLKSETTKKCRAKKGQNNKINKLERAKRREEKERKRREKQARREEKARKREERRKLKGKRNKKELKHPQSSTYSLSKYCF